VATDRQIPADPDRFNEAIRSFRRRVPMAEQDWIDLDQEQRSRAFKVAWVAHADIAEDIAAGVDRAIRDGSTLADFKSEMLDVLDDWAMPEGPHLQTIFRTNLSLAYNQGRREIFNKPAVRAARPYLRFDAIDDDRIDEECEDADGTVLAADDPWWDTHQTPLHFNCRCHQTALSKDEAEDEGIDDEGPDIDAAEGFGRAQDAGDWEPDTGGYTGPIGDILASHLR
jgi:SPP1 gp7 family putative phage head morphogenesis protein